MTCPTFLSSQTPFSIKSVCHINPPLRLLFLQFHNKIQLHSNYSNYIVSFMFVLILFGFCRISCIWKILGHFFFLQISPLPHSLSFLWVPQIILVLNLLTMFEKSLMLFNCQCFSCMFSSVLPFHLQILFLTLSIWFLVSWIWGVYW